MVLRGHVLDLEVGEAAALRGHADQGRWIGGVDVHADQVGIAHHQARLPERAQLGPNSIDVEPGAADHELGAVTPALGALRDGCGTTTTWASRPGSSRHHPTRECSALV